MFHPLEYIPEEIRNFNYHRPFFPADLSQTKSYFISRLVKTTTARDSETVQKVVVTEQTPMWHRILKRLQANTSSSDKSNFELVQF